LYPALADGTILQTWIGLRPRPHNRPAPIIEPLSGYRKVFLATGHYRNGVLLSPATALIVRDAACEFFGIPVS
ncbi:MAG: FAD-dependent oxidoreductase, partial [Cyanobacteria bacterium CAN_BIN43]|nr:FAD-dependent oxidoreductase [Cyanobacteria bacterium CAN_BIN43]